MVVVGLITRYLFFSAPNPDSASTAARRRNGTVQERAREAAVGRIQQMFPQVDRRTALWELQRSRGDIQATTERILSGALQTVSCFDRLPAWSSFPTPPRTFIILQSSRAGWRGQEDVPSRLSVLTVPSHLAARNVPTASTARAECAVYNPHFYPTTKGGPSLATGFDHEVQLEGKARCAGYRGG